MLTTTLVNSTSVFVVLVAGFTALCILISYDRLKNQRQLEQIHILVNSRLSEALDQIILLKRELIVAKAAEAEVPVEEPGDSSV